MLYLIHSKTGCKGENEISKTTIVGYSRIGVNRELKFPVEAYFKDDIDAEELSDKAKKLSYEL
ncbi:hypothetical protein [Clostridium pasteurianum]|uniref:hypothetical protein n=1 Tax=Clostridium pasteurianum TaxID=1501 RepID=UPI00039A4884|nr:hypothetical protein [Clostridium pasteurianum]